MRVGVHREGKGREVREVEIRALRKQHGLCLGPFLAYSCLFLPKAKQIAKRKKGKTSTSYISFHFEPPPPPSPPPPSRANFHMRPSPPPRVSISPSLISLSPVYFFSFLFFAPGGENRCAGLNALPIHVPPRLPLAECLFLWFVYYSTTARFTNYYVYCYVDGFC